MTSSSSAAAAAILPAPSSTLSPHAAPFTLPARPVCTPPGGRLDGDASRLIDDNFVLNGEDKKSYLVSPAVYFGMKSSDAAYPTPTGTHGIHQSHPSLSSGVRVNVYPSSTSSTSGVVSEPSATMASDLRKQPIPLTSGKGRNGCKYTRVTIRSPPNKATETNIIGFGSISKLAIRENDECNKESGKDISFHRNLEVSNSANDNDTAQGTMILSKELNSDFTVKPLHIPSTCASSCVSVADDVNPDPSECSVDSPCWRGASASRVSSCDFLQISAAQSIKQKLVEFEAGGEQSSSTVQHYEAPTELQNLVACNSKQNHSQHNVELGLPKKSGDLDTNLAKDPHGEEIKLAKHGAEKCITEQKHCLDVRDNCMKRSGLNTAAPDFIPSSIRKSNAGNGSCSSTGMNISGILKAIDSLSGVLQNNYSDEIELEEHDHSLLRSVIENLQSYLDKARKGPVKGTSDKAVLKGQNAVSKSVAENYNGSYTADNGKGIIISNLADSSHLLHDFGKNSLKGYQPSPNNFPKEFFCEEDHSQVLVYKSLWIDAERVNCELKYQLKQIHMEIDLDSSMAHIGGPRNPSLQLCDMDTDLRNSYGSAITSPPMLKDHPGARKSQNLLYAGDCIQSGDNSVLSRSKGYITVPKNIQSEKFLSGLEETGVRRRAHSGLQLAPNRSHRGLDSSTSDGVSSLSHITGRDDISRGSCELGWSDWEHVLKDEFA
ncbi:uncharacterized protein LOC133899346 [Phragmites australis]|uniref:uncharacterized protein LOC133899346 n=1 Tax=Phragmites australis TaxID=29695 RepID=UPI002D7817B0|nr:uncharacterized protein LOC133899346 [Phragmites australis]